MRTEAGAVVHCHAGCQAVDVLAALSLSPRDLYDHPRKAPGRPVAVGTQRPSRVVAEYAYCDEHGELLFTVDRLDPKGFRQRPASGRRGHGAMQGVRRVLYRLPEVLDAVEGGRTVYVVEGEKDADALAELGHVATCNPAGAGKWTGEYADGYDRALAGGYVVVVADRDAPGRFHAQQVAGRLATVAATVHLLEPAEGKDVSDHLAAGHTLGQLVPLPTAAGGEPPSEVVLPGAWQRVDLRSYLDGTHLPVVPGLLRRTDGLGLLYPGRVHWLSAEPEAGKTWCALLACAQVLAAGGRVLFLDLEDGPAGVAGRLLALGVPAEVIRERFDYRAPTGPLDVALRVTLAPEVRTTDLLVIDACTESLSAHGLSARDDVDIARWLELLPRWAARLGPAVLVLDHVVKDTESRGRWPTGSQHKLAGLDGAAYALAAVQPFGRGMTGRSRLTVEKDRHGQVRPQALPSSGGRAWLADLVVQGSDDGSAQVRLEAPDGEGEPFRPTVLMQRVSEVLARSPEPLSGRDVETVVEGRAAYVRKALALLVTEGHVQVRTGRNNRREHHLVTPFPTTLEPS